MLLEFPPQIFLKPGDVVASREHTLLKTILGSCVAVAVYDPEAGVCGLNHFLLPKALSGSTSKQDGRYGDTSLARLLHETLALGARKQQLRARIFGGAGLVDALTGGFNVGKLNIATARNFLETARIRVIGEDVGGLQGRHITFNTADFTVIVRAIMRSDGRQAV